MEKRGQISLEYMLIVGMATLIAGFLLVMSHYYSRQVEDVINTNQLDRIVKEVVDTSESMYYFGEPSKTTLKVYIPTGVNSVTINSQQLTFNVKTQSGDTDIFYSSSVPLQGDLAITPGFHFVTIEAKGGYVWINST
ncbi:MAG TPA: class III signal peptide-containing protein [Candidatus Nanoarchaeia archaeon]|nr:class III signal peptide-containing protein [Candidatus Nanoarchaeia archaeon]